MLGVRRKMDAFSEVLSGVRLKGAMFFSAEFSAPWRLSTPHSRTLASTLAPGAQHVVIYHFVVDGSARAQFEDGPDVELSPGDIVVFPHGDPHHLSGGSGANQVESAAGTPEDRDAGHFADARRWWWGDDSVRVRVLDL